MNYKMINRNLLILGLDLIVILRGIRCIASKQTVCYSEEYVVQRICEGFYLPFFSITLTDLNSNLFVLKKSISLFKSVCTNAVY